jgi:hypothetical protein
MPERSRRSLVVVRGPRAGPRRVPGTAARVAHRGNREASAASYDRMVCVECGAVADDEARGWRAYRVDLAAEAEAEGAGAEDGPAVVYYAACAAREFDSHDPR